MELQTNSTILLANLNNVINYGNYRQSNNDFQSNNINENVFCIHNKQSSICSPVFKLAAIYTHATHHCASFDGTCLFSALLRITYFCVPISISLRKRSKGFQDCPPSSLPETFQDTGSLNRGPRVPADGASCCTTGSREEPTAERSVLDSPVHTPL